MGILPATVRTGFTGEEVFKLGLKVYVGVCQAVDPEQGKDFHSANVGKIC